MKAFVNKDKCFGCGSCIANMENVFEFDDDGKAKVIVNEITEKDTQEKVIDFVDNQYCPGDAIHYEK